MNRGRTPTALLREKFSHIASSSPAVTMTSAPPAYKNVEESVGSQRERLVSFLKAEGLGEGEPNFKSTKLGTGERERFIAAVTVSGQQFKTYPKTYPSKVEAEEALCSLVLDKLKVKVVQKHSTLVDTKFPPPFKQPAMVATTEDSIVNRDTSPPIRHPSYNHGPPPISRTQEQAVPPEEKPTPPSPPASVCSTTFSRRGVRAEELFQASLAADNDRWLQFQIEPSVPAKEQSKQLDAWLAKNLPSKVARSQGIGWIAVKLQDKGKKVAEAKVAWEALKGPRNMKAVNKLAEEHSVLGGKWMCHLRSENIDRVWIKVASTLLAGGLGTPVYMVKVSPLEDVTPQQAGAGGEHVMIVYNTDYRDTNQVMRVENLLRCAGVTTPLNYKPDIFSALGIYRNNEWGFRPTIYTSHCIVSEGRSKVETVGTGEWFYNSSKGLQRPEGSGGSLRQARASGTNKSKGESLGVVAKRVGQKVCEGSEVNKHAQIISKPANGAKGTEMVKIDKERASQELSEEEALKVIAEKEIQPMSMMMTKEGLENTNTKTAVKKTASPVKKTTVQVEKSSDVKKSQTETDKLMVVKKVEAKKTLNKEKKKQLPAWMEMIEKQLGLRSLDEFANT